MAEARYRKLNGATPTSDINYHLSDWLAASTSITSTDGAALKVVSTSPTYTSTSVNFYYVFVTDWPVPVDITYNNGNITVGDDGSLTIGSSPSDAASLVQGVSTATAAQIQSTANKFTGQLGKVATGLAAVVVAFFLWQWWKGTR